jgi:hypothetical protein
MPHTSCSHRHAKLTRDACSQEMEVQNVEPLEGAVSEESEVCFSPEHKLVGAGVVAAKQEQLQHFLGTSAHHIAR